MISTFECYEIYVLQGGTVDYSISDRNWKLKYDVIFFCHVDLPDFFIEGMFFLLLS